MVSNDPSHDPSLWPAVEILEFQDAVAALTAAIRVGRPILLVSQPYGSAQGGALWFHRLTQQALAAVAAPTSQAGQSLIALPVLDCGDRAGDAQEAIATGLPAIRFSGIAAARRAIEALALANGTRLISGWPEPLSLRHRRDAVWTCEQWLRSQD